MEGLVYTEYVLCIVICGGIPWFEAKLTPDGNLTKNDIVSLVMKRLPETNVIYKDLTFGGDMRDISVSFEKIKRELGFEATLTPDDGVREVLYAIKSGLIRKPQDGRYRNARFIVQ